MLWVDPIHGWGEGEKNKDEEKISKKHIMRYLDVEYIALNSWIDPWMGTLFMD